MRLIIDALNLPGFGRFTKQTIDLEETITWLLAQPWSTCLRYHALARLISRRTGIHIPVGEWDSPWQTIRSMAACDEALTCFVDVPSPPVWEGKWYKQPLRLLTEHFEIALLRCEGRYSTSVTALASLTVDPTHIVAQGGQRYVLGSTARLCSGCYDFQPISLEDAEIWLCVAPFHSRLKYSMRRALHDLIGVCIPPMGAPYPSLQPGDQALVFFLPDGISSRMVGRTPDRYDYLERGQLGVLTSLAVCEASERELVFAGERHLKGKK